MSEPVYLIAQVDTADLPRYREEYGKQVVPLIVEHGGALLVGSAEAEILEGTWSGNWTSLCSMSTSMKGSSPAGGAAQAKTSEQNARTGGR